MSSKLRRVWFVLALSLLLSGCATYKFQKGSAPYDKGYVVSYDGKVIPEYTVGKNNSVPDMGLAKERFKRRRSTVEYYYKKMGDIESRFKEILWDPPAMAIDFIGGVLRWPFIAVSDYKYNRNPGYREKVDRLDEEKDELEKTRVNDLRSKLKVYIEEDLAREEGEAQSPVAKAPVTEPPPVVPAAAVENKPVEPMEDKQVQAEAVQPAVPAVTVAPVEQERTVAYNEEKVLPAAKPVTFEPPVAVISARPDKGFSPLQVNFNGGKSHSSCGKIVSYYWDFGDGDTSNKRNPVNTYWSTTYGVRSFVATLTVKDEKGQTASASVNIEVSTK
ncbi:MAG: PKD domain-containing protein [Candidatus Omnitrophica bacterium]|nr:PKD domain-containing protein [Candidatus Omnitrophota bacterium]MDD5771374.1 PKD domain-containing protein [Candidatus Omnitrophota bacterium]